VSTAVGTSLVVNRTECVRISRGVENLQGGAIVSKRCKRCQYDIFFFGSGQYYMRAR